MPHKIVSVAGLDSLDTEQRRLFDDAYHPWTSGLDLAVYWMDDGKAIVAPVDAELAAGMRVVAAHRAAVNFTFAGTDRADVHLVDELVPFTQDDT